MQTWQGPPDEHGDDDSQQESASADQQQSGSTGSLQQTERAQNQRDLNHKVNPLHVVIGPDSLVIVALATTDDPQHTTVTTSFNLVTSFCLF